MMTKIERIHDVLFVVGVIVLVALGALGGLYIRLILWRLACGG